MFILLRWESPFCSTVLRQWKNNMTNFLTEETPAKVIGLLSVALTSMFFLFVVTASNADFSGAKNPFPQGPSPANVVAVLDVASNSYSNFLNANLISPVGQQVAF